MHTSYNRQAKDCDKKRKTNNLRLQLLIHHILGAVERYDTELVSAMFSVLLNTTTLPFRVEHNRSLLDI